MELHEFVCTVEDSTDFVMVHAAMANPLTSAVQTKTERPVPSRLTA